MPKYTVEALRTIRTLQRSHEGAGHTAQAEQMRKVGDQVEAMQAELFDWQERANEHANNSAAATTDLIGLRAELAALKDAAKGLLAIHKRHKGLTVYSEQDYRDIWSKRVDALAALVGEG